MAGRKIAEKVPRKRSAVKKMKYMRAKERKKEKRRREREFVR